MNNYLSKAKRNVNIFFLLTSFYIALAEVIIDIGDYTTQRQYAEFTEQFPFLKCITVCLIAYIGFRMIIKYGEDKQLKAINRSNAKTIAKVQEEIEKYLFLNECKKKA